MLVQMAISRRANTRPTAIGAEISGDPRGAGERAAARSRPTRRGSVKQTAEAQSGHRPLFIINPLSGLRMDSLFTTHPPTEKRIRRLLAMAPPAPVQRGGWGAAPAASPWGKLRAAAIPGPEHGSGGAHPFAGDEGRRGGQAAGDVLHRHLDPARSAARSSIGKLMPMMFAGRAGISPRSTRFTTAVSAALAGAASPAFAPSAATKPLMKSIFVASSMFSPIEGPCSACAGRP